LATFSLGIKIRKLLLIGFVLLLAIPSYSASHEVLSPFNKLIEKLSPSDWIKEDQILVYDNKVIIDIENAEWASFTDTNSMDPVIDENAHAIEIAPKSYRDIQEGDIVSYSLEGIEGTIIHRIVETGFDSDGWYAITKGDNLDKKDPFKIRFENIKRVVVAIIY